MDDVDSPDGGFPAGLGGSKKGKSSKSKKRKIRGPLSSKPQDFQVHLGVDNRIRIISFYRNRILIIVSKIPFMTH